MDVHFKTQLLTVLVLIGETAKSNFNFLVTDKYNGISRTTYSVIMVFSLTLNFEVREQEDALATRDVWQAVALKIILRGRDHA